MAIEKSKAISICQIKKRADHIWQVRNSMAVYMAIANRGNRHMQIKKKRGSGHMASKKQHGSI